jgi:hypothetical protein
VNLLIIGLLAQLTIPAQPVLPVLSYPEPGMDDTAAYQGYQTRFYRDSKANTVQIYIERRGGRVVQLLADGFNESVGFTARDAAGRPARLHWGSDEALVSDSGPVRRFEYRLTAESPRVDIGWPLLGSMRVERDFQYQRGHLRPFGGAPFQQRELVQLIASLGRLPAAERRRHLALLHARSIGELRARLQPTFSTTTTDSSRTIRVAQPYFDDRNRLVLELIVDSRNTTASLRAGTISIRSRTGGPVTLAVRVSTDGPALTPLRREQIFTTEFLDFLTRGGVPRGIAASAAAATREVDSVRVHHARWLERQVSGLELLAAEEKLMAGLPNYATYFGRDMMMTALMMQPIWRPEVSEHVIASVLRKLSPYGEVSHEEALGGQAIREGGAEYAVLIAEYLRRGSTASGADSILARAREVLADLQRVRENYKMLDDDFQLPVLTARYLGATAVPAERKRAFLLREAKDGRSNLALLLREMARVAAMAAPYARQPFAPNLIAFPSVDATHWFPGSWRDSRVGYANGRFAMDINAIWVPQALASIGVILGAVHALGLPPIESLAPEVAGTPLTQYDRDPEALRGAVETWRGAARHFEVAFATAEVRSHVGARLDSLPADERRYWERVLGESGAYWEPIRFAALSLDSVGRPIPVANTDPATRFFLEDLTGDALRGDSATDRLLKEIDAFVRPYPVGLFVDRLGPLVANDAYATPAVWRMFRDDLYHSPRVVWGREVNLFVLGLTNQIGAAQDPNGAPREPSLAPYVRSLKEALTRTVDAIEASGLKHNELWSYRIEGGRLVPVRYPTSTDIQLWNVTDLAVQFALAGMK